jgi:hypothetical protein
VSRRTLIHTALVPAIALAAAQSGGCGSGSGDGPQAPSALTCTLDLQFTGPTHSQLTATVAATCTFIATSATTTLTIQHRPTGAGSMAWTNYDDPKSTSEVPPTTLTYVALCSGGEWEAVASIDGTGPDGQPFTEPPAVQALPQPLTDADCKAS